MCNVTPVRKKGSWMGPLWVAALAVVFGCCLAIIKGDPLIMAMVGIIPFLASCFFLAVAPNSNNGIIKVIKCLGDVSAAALSLATLLALPGWGDIFHTSIAWGTFLLLCLLIAGRTYRSL